MVSFDRYLLLVVLGTATSLYGATTTLVDEKFLDNSLDKTSQSGEKDVQWYFFNYSVDGKEFSVAKPNLPPLSGSVLNNPAGTTSNTTAIAGFSSVSLSKAGDSISMDFDYCRKVGTQNTGNTSNNPTFYFGLFSSNSTPVTATEKGVSSGASSNDLGYMIIRNVMDSSATAARKYSSGSSLFDAKTTLASNLAIASAGDSEVHHIQFVLTRIAEGLQIAISQDGAAVSTYTDTSPNTYQFDELGFRIQNMPYYDNLYVDNIVVKADLAAVPEPASLGIITTAGGMFLLKMGHKKPTK